MVTQLLSQGKLNELIIKPSEKRLCIGLNLFSKSILRLTENTAEYIENTEFH